MDQWRSKFCESFSPDRYWSIECSSLNIDFLEELLCNNSGADGNRLPPESDEVVSHERVCQHQMADDIANISSFLSSHKRDMKTSLPEVATSKLHGHRLISFWEFMKPLTKNNGGSFFTYSWSFFLLRAEPLCSQSIEVLLRHAFPL